MKKTETYKKFMKHYIISYDDINSLPDDEIILINTSFLYYTLAYYKIIHSLTMEKQILIQNALDCHDNNLIDPRYTYMKVLDIKRIYQSFPKNLFSAKAFLKPTLKTLTPAKSYHLLTKDLIHEQSDFNKTENRWIKHSIYVGLASKRIAKKLGLDENLAEALGYIHDIGRKINHFNHPIEGYNYMIKKGYIDQARICLTHSFINNDINLTAGGGPKTQETYEYIHDFLENNPADIYDNIIQLCDLFCLETGFTTIEKRLLDITKRKGVFDNSYLHYDAVINLKEHIESLMHCNLYDLFPEITLNDRLNQENDQRELKQLLESKTLQKRSI